MTTLDKILTVTNEELDKLNTGFISQYNFYHATDYFHGKSGREHYRLLMYVSSLFRKKTLYDIGTNKCMSAAAMSYKMVNTIKSYDLKTYMPNNPILPKVQYILGNVLEDEKLINSPLIFFDVDHDGLFEKKFYEHLKKINYKGLLICDDIKLGGEMEKWWISIKEKKYDISDKGHWSGTGLIHFK